jgi:putative addiction module component (TIGR02574 family)
MKKITASDALALSIPERIQLVEDIWDTIALEADSLDLTEHEKMIIDERLAAYHRTPDSGSPWGPELIKRLISKDKVCWLCPSCKRDVDP